MKVSSIFAIQAATKNARVATGMSGIGTEVMAGKVRVVNATPTKGGRFIVDPLSAFGTPDEAVRVLEAIANDGGFH